MKHIQTALILYPNQLFAPELLPEVDLIYVVEDPLFFGTDTEYPLALHKQKLVFHRASMRRYVEELLWPNELNVEYIELHEIEFSADVLVRARAAGAEQVFLFDPVDARLDHRLAAALDGDIETPFELRILPSPSFLLKQTEVRDYLNDTAEHTFADFYQWQRERFNILIDKNYKPVGGKWSYESTHSGPLPTGQTAPGFNGFGDNAYVKDATEWAEKHFAANPGNVTNFFWPTSHVEASAWLDEFLKERLEDFSAYQEAIDGTAKFLYHSGISAALNSGLLTPQQVVDTALAFHEQSPVNLPSLEAFIRQIIGWREYIRGVYIAQGEALMKPKESTSRQARALASQWWDGTTGIVPLDDVIKKVIQNAYVPQVERQLVVNNLMLLSEIAPDEIYKWCMSLFIDAYDWVVAPNVYSAYQFNYLRGMVAVSYIAPSNTVLANSHYQKDVWCDVWDGLYWSFVERYKDMLAKDPHTKRITKQLTKLDDDRRRIVGYRAQDFLTTIS